MSLWIAGIARGHNSGVCLLKDGEIVFSIEEERLSRHKYDGGPYASIFKIELLILINWSRFRRLAYDIKQEEPLRKVLLKEVTCPLNSGAVASVFFLEKVTVNRLSSTKLNIKIFFLI